MSDAREQLNIDIRAAQLDGAAKRENLGLAIKHESVATIRKAGDALTFTDAELKFVIGEIKHCRNDIVYFAEKYFRIIGDGGLQVIKLYPKQKELLRAMQQNARLICLASRQIGKCEFFSAYIKIRNKRTGIVETIPIGEFYNRIKKENDNEKD